MGKSRHKKLIIYRLIKRPNMFTKLAFTFLFIGLVPLLIIANLLLWKFASNVQDSIVNNTSQINFSIANHIQDEIISLDEISKSMYDYEITDYSYFYELLLDKEISDVKKYANIDKMLKGMLYRNPYIEGVYFVDQNSSLYYSISSTIKNIDKSKFLSCVSRYNWKNNSSLHIFPTHLANYYYSDNLVLTFARRYMNTSSIKTASTDILGTLYIDIHINDITSIVNKVNFKNNNLNFFILDKEAKKYIYNTEPYFLETSNLGTEKADFLSLIQKIENQSGFIRENENCLIYQDIPGTSWTAITQLSNKEMNSSLKAIKSFTIIILIISSCLLIGIYLFFSQKTSKPIRQLKKAMLQIQNGQLDTRVSIRNKDELGILAEGLNQMAINLQNNINRIYVAEIKQKETELEILKSQIQPHYLYNTLEVIKMTALEHDDTYTVSMLNSLSKQLRYLISSTGERVSLKEEIDNIYNYFHIIKIRYENRFELEINIPKSLLKLQVLKLILQPIVENSVKHGLLLKDGMGVISISAEQEETFLTIVVMDDGIGMSEKRLTQLYAQLDTTIEDDIAKNHIGIKNVNDRIKIKYGNQYGLTINSCLGLGTIVTFHLPIIEEE